MRGGEARLSWESDGGVCVDGGWLARAEIRLHDPIVHLEALRAFYHHRSWQDFLVPLAC